VAAGGILATVGADYEIRQNRAGHSQFPGGLKVGLFVTDDFLVTLSKPG
jgi:hypothetical protein